LLPPVAAAAEFIIIVAPGRFLNERPRAERARRLGVGRGKRAGIAKVKSGRLGKMSRLTRLLDSENNIYRSTMYVVRYR
jgi:hypothetical protein